MARNKEWEGICGLMGAATMDNGMITKYKVKANTNGLMVESLQGNGKITRCMGMGCILGRMVEYSKGTMNKIRRMGMAFTHGLMVVSMQVIGLMGSNMVREGIS